MNEYRKQMEAEAKVGQKLCGDGWRKKNYPEENQLLILLISLLSHFISRPVYLLIRNLMMNLLSYFLIRRRTQSNRIDFNLRVPLKKKTYFKYENVSEKISYGVGDEHEKWSKVVRDSTDKWKIESVKSYLLYIHCKQTVFRSGVAKKNTDVEGEAQ